MKNLYIVAFAAIASTSVLAQAPAGTLMRTPQEANGATSGGKPAANAQGKTDAKAAASMGSGRAMDMKAMDANGDGMISQEEYMAHHTKTWTSMRMTRNGMVSISDMQSQMKGGPN